MRNPKRPARVRRSRPSARARLTTDTARLQTVTGIVPGRNITKALAHEHMFTDFMGPQRNAYMDVNWSNKIGAAVENATVLRAQGVDLVIEWTNIGIGRNVVALRVVSQQSDVRFVCPTGIYKDMVSSALAGSSVNGMAAHFVGELAKGIDGTAIKAGFVKTACTESGATREEIKILRAAAIAAKETGAALGLHGPHAKTVQGVLRVLRKEGFSLERFVCAHAQVSSLDDNKRLTDAGAFVQYDAIGATTDQFFGGPTSDEAMLERLEGMIAAGFEDQILLSTDAAACINPPAAQYDRNNGYVYRYFEDKMKASLGVRLTRKILRDNVVVAFRRPTKL